jgi:hypothetical protein
MNGVKTVLVYMMIGALLGVVAASFIVPPVLAWYNKTGNISPNNPVQTLCDLPELIHYTSVRIIRGQLIGAGIGALVFLFPGVTSARRRRETAGVPATT